MNKPKILKVLNLLLALDFVIVAGTAVFRNFIPYDVYRAVHPLPGFLLILLVATHVYLNWGWIQINYLKRKG